MTHKEINAHEFPNRTNSTIFGSANPHCIGVPCKYLGYDCWLAIASTTHLDLHGERIAKQQISDFEQTIATKYIGYQYNHNGAGPKLGVIVSAKLFDLSDGEAAIGIIIVEYTDNRISKELQIGAPNTLFEKFQKAIIVDLLVELDKLNMLIYVPPKLTLEDKLESFFQSHIIDSSGRIRTNKYFVTEFGKFTVEVYPKDHRPAHCHIISTQRRINARFTLEPFGLMNMKQGKITGKDKKIIMRFFSTHPDELENLQIEARRLELAR